MKIRESVFLIGMESKRGFIEAVMEIFWVLTVYLLKDSYTFLEREMWHVAEYDIGANIPDCF